MNRDLKSIHENVENSIITSPEASRGQLVPASMIPLRNFEQIKTTLEAPHANAVGSKTSVIYSKK